MPKFRKKPIVIEAVRIGALISDAKYAWASMPAWAKQAYEEAKLIFLPDSLHIHTLEGVMVGNWDDWLIQGISGELYPCKDDIFRATYEPVEEQP